MISPQERRRLYTKVNKEIVFFSGLSLASVAIGVLGLFRPESNFCLNIIIAGVAVYSIEELIKHINLRRHLPSLLEEMEKARMAQQGLNAQRGTVILDGKFNNGKDT